MICEGENFALTATASAGGQLGAGLVRGQLRIEYRSSAALPSRAEIKDPGGVSRRVSKWKDNSMNQRITFRLATLRHNTIERNGKLGVMPGNDI